MGKRFARADAKDQQDLLVCSPLSPSTTRIPILTSTKTQGSFIRHGLSQRKCETEALIQIIAGSDTTATTIRVVMLYLMSTPRAYKALQAEIDAGIRTGRVSSPVTSAEAQDMPYLQVSSNHNQPLPPFSLCPITTHTHPLTFPHFRP